MNAKKTRKTSLIPAHEVRVGRMICCGKRMFIVTEIAHFKNDKYLQCTIRCDKYKFDVGADWPIPVFDGFEGENN